MICPKCGKEVDKLVPVLMEGYIDKRLLDSCRDCALESVSSSKRSTWTKNTINLEKTRPKRL